MPENFTVQAFASKGEKPNPHGGTLYKWEVALRDEKGETHHKVYWQSKSDSLHEGQEVYGEITEGDYGPRFRTAQREEGTPAPSQGTPGVQWAQPVRDERGRRIERQHSQEMAIRTVALSDLPADLTPDAVKQVITFWTDHFQKDLDADLGGGEPESSPREATSARSTGSPAADVSAAPPALKARATHLMNQAGLAKGARQAVIMFRCGTLSDPPKDKLMALVKDLEEGANAEYLLAEVSAARAAGNPLGARAAAMIPTDVPNAEPPPEPTDGDEKIPF